MDKKRELEVDKRLRSQLGSCEPFMFMKDAIEEMKERFSNIKNVRHIRATNLDSFKKEIEKYSNKHPNENVKVTAFILTTKD